MTTNKRTTDCKGIHREIEEAGGAESLSLRAHDHLKSCAGCQTFYQEDVKLGQVLASLGPIKAPGDFDFRLRARLADEKRRAARPLTTLNFSFGYGLAAFAAVVLLIGSAFLFVNLRTRTDNPLVAKNGGGGKQEAGQSTKKTTAAPVQTGEGRKGEASDDEVSVRPETQRRRNTGAGLGSRPAVVARDGSRRVSIDVGLTPAPVIRTEDPFADGGHSVFPIDASSQSLKVSVDDGRGSSKTISLPGVSFGSQRVLTQGRSPLLASSRGAW